MLAPISLSAFLSLASLVAAGGVGRQNWGISTSVDVSVSIQSKSSCSGAGSFFTDFGGKALCCSDKTRTPPKDVTCPFNWFQHTQEKCCVPPKEVDDCDCGEGFGWSGNKKTCGENNSNKCKHGHWYHDRSDSCCDDNWGSNPPSGDCPHGKTCPKDWFWHKEWKRCVPHHKRSPAPDCPDWDDHNQCCGGGGPQPSQGVGGGHNGGGNSGGHNGGGQGGGNGGHQGGWKRDFLGRQQSVIDAAIKYPQSDLDKLYCPRGLHACSIVTPGSEEWAYECIDFATELESCGGCASMGEGQDCTTTPNALSVGCEQGSCAIYSCKSGFALNGTSCLPN